MPGHPADLVRLNKHGRIIGQYQLKLGRVAVLEALGEQKYVGMKIIAPPDTIQSIRQELQKEILKAQNSGKAIAPKWLQIANAIKSGQLTDNIDGYQVPTTKQAEAASKIWTKNQIEEVRKGLATNTDVQKQLQTKIDYGAIYRQGGVPRWNYTAGLDRQALRTAGFVAIAAVGIDAASQYMQTGEVNFGRIAATGAITGGSVLAGIYTGTQTSLLLTRTGGKIAGGGVASVLISGGLYATGQIDGKTAVTMAANGIVISSVISVTGYAVSQGMLAYALAYGTASTGTAISSLHGAVALGAAKAWLGGGALAAGGSGVAGGTAVLASIATGVGIVAVVGIVSYSTYKYFKNATDSHRYLQGIIAVTQKRVQDGEQPEWQ
ncbi:hypothetical protein FACS189454_09130 [Planctomycetales bacterium]|nr:hypothetical protein FACS189454_09130 [Planctomycetales bacterium]